MVRYFIRDDDVGELTDAFKVFVETFVSLGIPVSYQIIPSTLTPSCAAFLVGVSQAHPGLIELGQHGLHHRMVLGRRELKREFGPERDLAEQTRVIAEGLTLLRNHFKDETIRVFTPPQHKFDGNTVRAAAAAGHSVFSAACYPTQRHQLAYALGRRLGLSSVRHQGISYHGHFRPEADIFEMSIAIDVDDGRTRKRTAAGVLKALGAPVRGWPHVGLMLHHELYGDQTGRAALAALSSAFAALDRNRFVLLSEAAILASSIGPVA